MELARHLTEGLPETLFGGLGIAVGARVVAGFQPIRVDVSELGATTESDVTFLRGDCNADGSVDNSDAVSTLVSLFLGEGDPGCEDACDSNDDGTVDISDAINTLGALFLGNGVIPLPGMMDCGVDPTDDEISCETFERCL